MTILDTFEQGESIGRTILLTEVIDGTTTVIDTSTLLTISILVKYRFYRSDYSVDDAGDYTFAAGTVIKLSPTTGGYIFFDIPPSISATLSIGIYEYQITTTENDATYDGGVRTRVFKGYCFKLIKKVAA